MRAVDPGRVAGHPEPSVTQYTDHLSVSLSSCLSSGLSSFRRSNLHTSSG